MNKFSVVSMKIYSLYNTINATTLHPITYIHLYIQHNTAQHFHDNFCPNETQI